MRLKWTVLCGMLVACQVEQTDAELCDAAALVYLHDKQDVAADFVASCQSSLEVLKAKESQSYQVARGCLSEAQTAADLECATFIARTPEMLCDRLAKTLWRNNRKLNENGFETCTDMLERFKTKGDMRFMKSVTCIEGAKTLEDLDCVLELQEDL